MTNIVQKVIQYGRILVNETKHSELADSEAVKNFIKIFSGLTLEDLNIRPNELQFVPRIPKRYQAPVSFVNVFMDDTLSLQLFGLRDRNARIPPHDHPAMHGFVKCINGAVRIKSFNLLPQYTLQNVPDSVRLKVKNSQLSNLVGAVFVKEEVVSAKDGHVCCLTPTIGNIHEILSASDEVAVIADVIMPPYANETACNFFEPMFTVYDEQINENVTWMLKSFDPKEFHCQDVPYHGPSPVPLEAKQE